MNYKSMAASIALLASAFPAHAQCFNRQICPDPSMLEVHSQISVTVPFADQASSADTMKTMEDARHDLYELSNRECESLKTIYGGDCSLSAVNINSSIQDRMMGKKAAMVSISNTYQIKKAPK